MQKYNPEIYWDERAKMYGHTGYADELIYFYDQPLRIRAVNKVLSWSKVPVNVDTKILDIGCGTGDLLIEFAKKGASTTGIDISNEVLLKAQHKAYKEKVNATLIPVKVEEMSFPANTFDLVTSITVLQHITDKNKFLTAIKKLVEVTKPGGHILIFEISPYKKRHLNYSSYISIRLRDEYVKVFENMGCILINEFGYPRIGIKAIQLLSRVIKTANYLFSKILGKNYNQKNRSGRRSNPYLRIYGHIKKNTS